jgi:hypothetical protein
VKLTPVFVILSLSLFGCDENASVPVSKASAAPAPISLSAEKLRDVFPKIGSPLTVVEFRAKPGIVTKHVRKGDLPIATLMVQDLLGDSGAIREFDGASAKAAGYPAISTSMGGGVAVLAENRFRVEVVSLGPEVTDKVRSQWLEGFRWETLKGYLK